MAALTLFVGQFICLPLPPAFFYNLYIITNPYLVVAVSLSVFFQALFGNSSSICEVIFDKGLEDRAMRNHAAVECVTDVMCE